MADSKSNFIPTFLIVVIFFGLSESTTQFFFPTIGSQVFETIRFYLIAIIALKEYNRFPFPRVYDVAFKYIIALPIFYITLSILFSGTLKIPRTDDIILETIISYSENLLVIYFIPSIWGLGIYGGTLLNRVRFHLPAIAVITALHTGRYALVAGYDLNSLIISIAIVFVLFVGFVTLKEKYDFGVSEAAHAGWNVMLMTTTGSII